jgi:hypothetical protein
MVKATLTEVRDLGMQVNRHKTNELVDHCILKFKTEEGDEVFTYELSKTTHASSKLGKMIRTILGRNLEKTDYITVNGVEGLDSDILLNKKVYLEIENQKVTGVVEAQ